MNSDLAIINARIWTGDPSRPSAHSIVVTSGRVASLDKAPPKGVRVIDAKGRVVTPGLIDSHVHLLNGGLSLQQLDLSKVHSRKEFEHAIEQRHQEIIANGDDADGRRWLIAHGWSSEHWGGDDPDASWLKIAGARPAVCYRMDHHAVLVNDAVLKMIDTNVDPPGGKIVRDAKGKATGLLVEAAAWKLVNPILPKSEMKHKKNALRAAQQHCHALGLTSVGSMEYGANVRDVFDPMREELSLRCRITLLDRDWPVDFSFGEMMRTKNDDRLAVIGYKAFIDGTLGSRTAYLYEDYCDDRGNRGMLVELALEGHLQEWAREVARRGFSPSMHAIGDAAAGLALDVIEEHDGRLGDDNKSTFIRIEHAQQLVAKDIKRFRNVVASMQPLHLVDDGTYAEKRLGSERLKGSFAFRSQKNAGALLAFGSDWPIVSADPILGIRAAVTGLTSDDQDFLREEKLTVEETMIAFTRDAARSLGMKDAGVLCEGALGDLVMYDHDPFGANWRDKSALPAIVLTVAGGEVVYGEL